MEQNGFEDKMLPYASKGDTALYFSYRGYFAVLRDDVDEAERFLTRALEECAPSARANRRRIVTLLVPVRLCRGFAPSPALLRAYGLDGLFGGIVRGVTRGDGAAFREAMDRNMEAFIRLGLFLFIDKMQLLVLRTLVKRYSLLVPVRTRISAGPLVDIMGALRLSPTSGDEPVSKAELECLLSVLISRKLIMGYINHDQLMLVVSNTNAFPKISKKPWWKRV